MGTRRCVVVGDTVDSRAVADRSDLRDRLDAGIERANELLGEELCAPFEVLKGVDEVGGVLRDPGSIYPPIRAISEAIHPTAMRFAVVWGEIDVGQDADTVAEMDGPAFHEADRRLRELGDTDRAVSLAVPGTDPWLVRLVANQMHLLAARKQDWTTTQAAVVRQYRELDNMQAVADRRDVSVQTVSKTLQRANAASIVEIEADLDAALSELWGEFR